MVYGRCAATSLHRLTSQIDHNIHICTFETKFQFENTFKFTSRESIEIVFKVPLKMYFSMEELFTLHAALAKGDKYKHWPVPTLFQQKITYTLVLFNYRFLMFHMSLAAVS